MDESRKAFEEWLENYHGIKASNSGYANMVEMYWQAWKASREAIEIELPEWFSPHDCGDRAMWSDAVEKAIRAAGIKVKE